MTRLILERHQLRALVSPVLPWLGAESGPEFCTMVRIFTHAGSVYATATDGRAVAIARVGLDSDLVDFMIPGRELDALTRAPDEIQSFEFEDHGDRIALTLNRDDLTIALDEIRTRAYPRLESIAASAAHVLAVETRGVPGMTAADLQRLSRSLAVYGASEQVACDLHADDRLRGYLVAAHVDRFLLLISNASGSRTGTSEKVRHVGMSSGRGSTFVAPLDVWPGILQEVPL